MPWRLAQFIVIFAIFLLFIMFNLGNASDLNFGFTIIRDVPVFLTVFFAFAGGIIFAIPFILASKFHKKDKPPKEKRKRVKNPDKQNENNPANSGQYGID